MDIFGLLSALVNRSLTVAARVGLVDRSLAVAARCNANGLVYEGGLRPRVSLLEDSMAEGENELFDWNGVAKWPEQLGFACEKKILESCEWREDKKWALAYSI